MYEIMHHDAGTIETAETLDGAIAKIAAKHARHLSEVGIDDRSSSAGIVEQWSAWLAGSGDHADPVATITRVVVGGRDDSPVVIHETNMNQTPTVAEVIASYPAKSYRKYDEQQRLLDWAGTPIGVDSRVEWYDADGQLATGIVRRIDDRIGACWDGSTDAALSIKRTPNHTAICSSRSVRVIG